MIHLKVFEYSKCKIAIALAGMLLDNVIDFQTILQEPNIHQLAHLAVNQYIFEPIRSNDSRLKLEFGYINRTISHLFLISEIIIYT